jgi:hypothetical protein
MAFAHGPVKRLMIEDVTLYLGYRTWEIGGVENNCHVQLSSQQIVDKVIGNSGNQMKTDGRKSLRKAL